MSSMYTARNDAEIIDDMVAQAIKSSGGFVWACKNYDGDVMVRLHLTKGALLTLRRAISLLRASARSE